MTTASTQQPIGTMMGVRFLTLAAAAAIGGPLATLANSPKGASTIESLAIYNHAFLLYGGIVLGSGCVKPFFNPLS